MPLLFLIAALILQLCGHSQDQINQGKIDSLKHSIENERKAFQQWQDSFNKRQDSIYRSAQNGVDFDQNNRNLLTLMQQIKDREEKQKQQAYLRIGLGVLIFVVMVVLLARRKKRSSGPI